MVHKHRPGQTLHFEKFIQKVQRIQGVSLNEAMGGWTMFKGQLFTQDHDSLQRQSKNEVNI